MESIGKLAGGIAHDFNNLLTAINGYSALSLTMVEPGSQLHGNLFEIKTAGERAAVLTRQLLAYSRKQVLAPKVLRINEIVSEMHNMLKRIIGEDLEMVLDLDPDLGAAKADPGQIEQVILNLVVNARDATPSGGRITLSTGNAVWGKSDVPAGFAPGQYVLLSVRDTGTGMEPHIISRIFEPFFTTKEFGKGSGMGLSMVDGIVTQSGGFIKVESAPGKGSTFKVYLPKVALEENASHADVHSHDDLRGKETVLLVEDEETVRRFIRQILEMHGYKVMEGKDGQDGLKVSEGHEGSIDVLLTDVIMPRMNGRELAERILRARPRIKVLFMSGYTDDAIVRQGLLEADTNFLQKPFTPTQLATAVREILDQVKVN
jgi:CheY-like chemotaxis protein